MKRIFHLTATGEPMALTRAPFENEAELQAVIANHPEIIGAAINRDLLLVRREQPIADKAGGGDRWSIDHLFVDRDGTPVLVEVKRATDTRARREVVAQMLDYAANGSAYWNESGLRDGFAATCKARGPAEDTDPEHVLSGFLEEGADPAAFWQTLEGKLRNGQLMMLFVADQIPDELSRIVEFLNEQLNEAEILAVKIGLFRDGTGARTLVPELIGATRRAADAKRTLAPLPTKSPDDWLVDFRARNGEGPTKLAEKLFAAVRNRGGKIVVARSLDSASGWFSSDDGTRIGALAIRLSTGRVELPLERLARIPIFIDETPRQRLVDAFRAFAGPQFYWSGRVTGSPAFPIAALASEDTWAAYIAFLDRLVTEASGRHGPIDAN